MGIKTETEWNCILEWSMKKRGWKRRDDGERKTNTVYAGKVRRLRAGFIEQNIIGKRACADGAFPFCALALDILGDIGAPFLQLFQDVFQKLFKEVCGKPGVYEAYGQNPSIHRAAKKYDASEKNASYLQMPQLRAKNQNPQGKRENCGKMPEMQHGIYQKELMGILWSWPPGQLF